jgi:hypothetical protein
MFIFIFHKRGIVLQSHFGVPNLHSILQHKIIFMYLISYVVE